MDHLVEYRQIFTSTLISYPAKVSCLVQFLARRRMVLGTFSYPISLARTKFASWDIERPLRQAFQRSSSLLWAPRKISPYGVMTGVRVRSEVDRSILGLSSRPPEVATGFSGVGLIGSTHATERVARRFTRPRPSSFQDIRSGACCRRGSSFRFCTARGRCRWCARSRFPSRSFDHQIHARRGRAHSSASYWRPSAPH